jgi:hypothetical protein
MIEDQIRLDAAAADIIAVKARLRGLDPDRAAGEVDEGDPARVTMEAVP